ncbi:cytochrome c-type biogenesis protein CcsB [Tamaricihabitans halophyticus]|uniref:Cytochrome c-type biogenesis protein CcsB n=1 Tax=Tamaricihabitans halophyticus TaxID=1262583 RepID=A0A4R2QT69_9PSEU|nr:c-type cytochrome biogenesis protein CcsB [Tamaricihabitans halophyticus]TCP53122.1 cytochrome c-type biogenesis protein CcsB [Tamaricihabitans halophyticus]
MPVNETLSTFSDYSFRAALLIYVLALAFYAAEQAFGRSRRQAVQRQRERELVGTGGRGDSSVESTAAATGRDTSDTDEESWSTISYARSLPDRVGRMAVALTVLGILVHLASLVLRGFAAGRVPWGNMYEFISVTCVSAVIAWVVVLRKVVARYVTAYVLLPVVILMFIAGTALYTTAAPVQPALDSYWIVIHVSTVAASSGLLLVPGVASVLYLFRRANAANPQRFAGFVSRLPSEAVLDRIAYRTTVFAFPIYTFAIIVGAVWAEAAWGRFWGWDPKETVSFIAWVIYAAYLHSRATAGWRGIRAAVINTVGFAAMIFNLFFVNLVTAGLHSYAGVG